MNATSIEQRAETPLGIEEIEVSQAPLIILAAVIVGLAIGLTAWATGPSGWM